MQFKYYLYFVKVTGYNIHWLLNWYQWKWVVFMMPVIINDQHCIMGSVYAGLVFGHVCHWQLIFLNANKHLLIKKPRWIWANAFCTCTCSTLIILCLHIHLQIIGCEKLNWTCWMGTEHLCLGTWLSFLSKFSNYQCW